MKITQFEKKNKSGLIWGSSHRNHKNYFILKNVNIVDINEFEQNVQNLIEKFDIFKNIKYLSLKLVTQCDISKG